MKLMRDKVLQIYEIFNEQVILNNAGICDICKVAYLRIYILYTLSFVCKASMLWFRANIIATQLYLGNTKLKSN